MTHPVGLSRKMTPDILGSLQGEEKAKVRVSSGRWAGKGMPNHLSAMRSGSSAERSCPR